MNCYDVLGAINQECESLNKYEGISYRSGQYLVRIRKVLMLSFDASIQKLADLRTKSCTDN